MGLCFRFVAWLYFETLPTFKSGLALSPTDLINSAALAANIRMRYDFISALNAVQNRSPFLNRKERRNRKLASESEEKGEREGSPLYGAGVLSAARFCYVFPCELGGPVWAVGSYSISQSAGGTSQNIIFKTLRQIGRPALYIL